MKIKYIAGVCTLLLVTAVAGCSGGDNEISAESCKSDTLRQMSDEKAMWELSGRCLREGVYELNS